MNINKKVQIPDFLFLDEEKLSNITHNLSHDIGNPLTSIITYGSLIQQAQNLNISADKLENYAKSLLGETWKISILMEKYLMLVSKKPNTSTANIKDVASRIMSRYGSRYGLNDFDLELVGFDQNICVSGDIEQICSMLCELLTNSANAIKFLKSKDVDVELSLTLSAGICDEEDAVIFEIRNLSEKHDLDLSSLMQPGFSANHSGKQSIGIGLSAVYNTASRFNGVFEISESEENDTSVPNIKTNFFISKLTLPIVEV